MMEAVAKPSGRADVDALRREGGRGRLQGRESVDATHDYGMKGDSE
jgi:hypothetical protein